MIRIPSRREILAAATIMATIVPVPTKAYPTPSSTLLAIAPSSPYTAPLIEADSNSSPVIELASGVTYRDLREGKEGGDVAIEGKRVNIQWSLKRNNGYSIDSSAQNDGVPFIFVVGGKQDPSSASQSQLRTAIPGLDEGIRGMKVGGIRRIVIPPSLAYVGGLDDLTSPGPVPKEFGPKQRIKRVMENRKDVPDESFMLDVKLTRVRDECNDGFSDENYRVWCLNGKKD